MKPTLTILAIAVSASLLSSCAVVLGFEDHEPYPAGGAGGSSTTSGTGGTGGAVPSPHFGAPEVIASGQAGPSHIVLDSATVYWVNVGFGVYQAEIAKIPKSGGDPAQIIVKQAIIRALEVDPTNVLCVVANNMTNVAYIATAGKKDEKINWPPVFYNSKEWVSYFTMALQGYAIAWSSMGKDDMGSIFRGDTMGNTPDAVATNQGQVGSIALDGNVTYWVSPQQSAIMRSTNPKGGTVEAFATGQSNPTDIALDADSVYWTCNDGTVKRLAKTSPGGQPTVIAGDALAPQGIALDATNVYWAENAVDGRVRTAPKSGGKVDTIATGQNPFDIATDASDVYVTMQGDGNIIRIPKQ